jgi:hypothetical protein
MPLFPDDTGLTFRVHMLRPQFRLETREFDVGSFSGPMDLHEICGLPETGWGAELLMGGESYRVSMFATFQKGKVVTDEAVTLEQHVFPPGTRLETFAHLVTLEGFWRHAFIGGREKPVELRFLAGLQAIRYHVDMTDDVRQTSEGFSALWPVPALGLEGRWQLTDRLSLRGAVYGTRLKFKNPFQLDGGETQKVNVRALHADAGAQWDLSTGWSVGLGMTALDYLVENSSPEDKDTGSYEALGLNLAAVLRF